MLYENRQPPEGINAVSHGWKRDFVLLVVGFFAALALACWLLLSLVAWAAKWMPFHWEQSLAAPWFAKDQADERTAYLQDLAESLAMAGGLSPDLAIQLHYSSQPTANAFATLGGNIVVLEGLFETLTSEQGLAFVLAHEIAHIYHRDPVRAMARGLSISVMGGLIFGQTDLAHLAGLGGNLILLDYSRQQEAEADAWALRAVFRRYGHVAGADELFQALLQKDLDDSVVPEWLASHPDLASRIRSIAELVQHNGYAKDAEPTPLPVFTAENSSPASL